MQDMLQARDVGPSQVILSSRIWAQDHHSYWQENSTQQGCKVRPFDLHIPSQFFVEHPSIEPLNLDGS